jgi:hypothetical protein
MRAIGPKLLSCGRNPASTFDDACHRHRLGSLDLVVPSQRIQHDAQAPSTTDQSCSREIDGDR